ncbi:uncharacterized protein METZ01_LOCUS295176 [marine metagenome]|uniref:Uncharacterized protein n=1 Tax=marine metagenome TaxID=408172 RepID=A0A382M4P2_9ZZZZ
MRLIITENPQGKSILMTVLVLLLFGGKASYALTAQKCRTISRFSKPKSLRRCMPQIESVKQGSGYPVL